jgi:hypothetical protein
MNKHKIEDICRRGGMVPVWRDTVDGAQIFIADGWSSPPHHVHRRFGVEADEFPFGCYVTLWWVSRGEDKLDIGQPLFFDALKVDSRNQKARISRAIKEASLFMRCRKKVRLDA